MMAMDTDLAPIVGQQVTLTSTNAAVAGPRITLMIQRANTNFVSKVLIDLNGGPVNECELIAKLNRGGAEHGYLKLLGDAFQPDDAGPPITDAALRAMAAVPGQEVTYTCAPPGSGLRMGIDRDEDTLLDGVETGPGAFVSRFDTGTDPALADTDADGFNDDVEVALGTDPNDPLSFPGTPAVPGLSLGGRLLLLSLLLLAPLAIARTRRLGRA